VFNRFGVAIVDEGIVMENMVEHIKMKGFLGGDLGVANICPPNTPNTRVFWG
jgi:hypothetical protein